MKPDIQKKLNSAAPRKIKQLQLENGRLRALPIELKKFDKLKTLNLFNNKLTELPDFFSTFEHLEHLNFSNNEFVVFPEQLSYCENLKTLSVRSNRLNNLIGIDVLSNSLEKLDLSANKLEILRTDFSRFISLKEVDLSDNRIIKFPKSLLNDKLKVLKLSSNKISKLSPDIGKLKSLRVLDLSYNNIQELPEEICELTELRELNLTGNMLPQLPRSFAKLKKLQKLNLNGNPIGEVPIEISNQGLSGVLNYYLNLGESVRLNEAKLLIVGQGAVGKTYLMNKMINGSSPETISTEGIDIVKWNLNFNQEEDEHRIRLNAWDFGGQEIYHSTHQFFLTKRSIYLFVWEARTDESLVTFDYWLNIIKVLSNSSPVIIVLNKIDERTKEIDEKSIMEQFPNIKAFKAVSAKEGTNIEALKEEIKSNVLKLPHIHDKLPKVWNQIRGKLEGLSDNYISYESYIEICNSFGLRKEQSKHLSRYFHDLGVLLHFIDNTVLKSVVFLKPAWATNCVYRILDLHEVISNFGEFSTDILDEHLEEYNSQQICYIIELMKRFEICFELKKNVYIIPELLRPTSLEMEFNKQGAISLVYKYDFMPAGILPRLTVRLKDLIHGNKYWKNGVYLTYENTFGRAVVNQFSRTIKIEVNGESKALLLGMIKRELDIINRTLNYPTHSVQIQCNCENCQKSETPYMFDYNYLERVKRAGLEVVQCQDHIVNVNLEKLIGPYEIFSEQYSDEFRYNSTELTYDLLEVSSRILERKYSASYEDLITDYFTDNLRTKGYKVTDQTRSGRSKKQSGELDIMIRNSRNMPVAIVEAMRLSSFGMGNKTIIDHLNKMLIDYDTNGLSRNFMLIYSQASNFSELWLKYKEYFEKLSLHHLYDTRAKLISFAENEEMSKSGNVKVLISQHQRDNNICEVVHIVVNMN